MPNAFPIDLGVVFVTKERRRTPHLERMRMFSCYVDIGGGCIVFDEPYTIRLVLTG